MRYGGLVQRVVRGCFETVLDFSRGEGEIKLEDEVCRGSTRRTERDLGETDPHGSPKCNDHDRRRMAHNDGKALADIETLFKPDSRFNRALSGRYRMSPCLITSRICEKERLISLDGIKYQVQT